MELPAIIALVYLAIGAAIFAHPPLPVTPYDFHWRRQIGVFGNSFRDVMIWPLALWLRTVARR